MMKNGKRIPAFFSNNYIMFNNHLLYGNNIRATIDYKVTR